MWDCLGTPQWNGVSERRNRTLLDMVRSMMSHADLPTSFWGHALETAIFTLNCVLSKSIQKTPYEMWTGKRPNQDEPRTYQEAVASPASEKWLEAMRSEMDSMYENQVWTLVDPHEGVKPIGCKILLAIAAFHDYEIWQMDIKTAFLNGKLEEDVYMTQPEGFVDPKDAGKIYEPCVYKKVSGNTIIFLVLYVDDILIMGNDIPTLQSIKTWLGSCFSMKDLGEATYILGVKIYRDRSRRLLGLSQDVSYALSMTSRYQVDPGEGHWTTVKNILKYLRRTKDTFLIYGGEEELSVKGYTDASFQIDKDDSRSQSGFVFCLNGGAMSSKSSKQSAVADSTTEAEYIAASEAAKRSGVVPSISDAIELRCDNNGAIAQAKEPRSHQRSKHILRRYHLIREIIDRGDVEICRVPTDDNIADPLTKSLTQQKHDRHLVLDI
ncbi:hypothetical protein CXB51_021928 [Gossypium anomalum]|uniref:Reverse transcriptase Ty1/copia-type domain-containing protein n=1 Tax=Gossypium anomalum TaxID=47600 RepID=A0A8J5YUV8_9ROSI|nr:hypothetical protein CXB51_021928 [Gossypium anomalum]